MSVPRPPCPRWSVLASLAAAAACGAEPLPVTIAGDWPVAVELPAEAQPRYERVVLVTIDTLRADHVSCYGYPRRTTPFLDELSRRGALFTRAVCTVSHTAPSHTSILTGLPPVVHGVLHNGYQLDGAAVDLAQVFAGAGFETAAFVNTEFLTGVTPSFETVEFTTERGEEVVRLAREWLTSRRRSGRFFLWVHLFDPHRWKDLAVERGDDRLWNGATPERFYDFLAEAHGLTEMGTEGLLAQEWETVQGKPIPLDSVEEYLRFVDAYDMLVLYADQQVQKLFTALQGLGLPGPALWVVTSDHGEGLASHGTDGHGGHIYQEQLHVPLLVLDTEGGLAGRRVETLVSHLDLFPTLVETLGGRARAPDDLLEGRSLWPLLQGGAAGWAPRSVFAQRKPTQDPLYSLQTERHKLIESEFSGDEFYDLAADPRELENRIAEESEVREQLLQRLAERLRVYRSHGRAAVDQEIPEAWTDELEKLGYR